MKGLTRGSEGDPDLPLFLLGEGYVCTHVCVYEYVRGACVRAESGAHRHGGPERERTLETERPGVEGGRAGLFLLSVSFQDVREGCSLSDTGCQPMFRQPSLAGEQWGSLLSPPPSFVSPPIGKDKREGTWLSGH